MPARSFKTHFIAVDLVNQQPIRLDVSIPEAAPPALKRMVFVLRGHASNTQVFKQGFGVFSAVQVLAALAPGKGFSG